MADPPKSTADILAAIRKQKEAASTAPPAEQPSAPETPAAESAAGAPAGETAPESGAQSKTPAASGGEAPKGTSSILAAIRSQKGAGGAAPAGEAPPAAKSPAEGAPKGTSSILAAIRGGGGAPAGGKAASTPAAAAKAPPPAPKAGGERPTVQDMLKAVKAGVKLPGPDAPKPLPRLPGGTPSAAKPKVAPPERRNVLAPILGLVATPFALAWTLMTLLAGVFTLKGAQFMMPNMVLELPSRFKIGVTSDYPLGGVSEKYKASRGIWIVHSDAYDGNNLVYALASVCTHLGCTPNWLEGEQKFKCPCHGSGFYISGINFEGPAPRPLERVGIRIAEDGQIEVDKSVKFQEELGQWADTKSFIELV